MSQAHLGTAAARPAALLTLVIGAAAAGQQIVDQTASRFPSPGPLEYSNQLTIGDLDGDGDLDIIFANGGNFNSAGPNLTQRVYINNGAAVFTDESAARLGFAGLCRGVELGDIERDGDLDIIFAQDFNRVPQLFLNDGSGDFTNVTAARLPNIALSSSRAQFGDIDNDGDLDLYITNGGSTNRFGCGQYMVYVNDGNGFFTDETALRHPIGAVCQNMDCIFGDIDNDFDIDVRTGSTGSNNSRLYRNNGAGVFTLVAGVPNDDTTYSYDFGDMNGDGDLDLLGINAVVGSSAELLLSNNGSGAYTNVSSQIVPNTSLDDNDSKFFDYDNDGDLDLIIARLGGPERVYNNSGAGNFTQVSGVITQITDSSLDVKVADLDDDGDLDVVTAQGESGSYLNRIYINSGPADTQVPRIIRTEQHPDTKDTSGPYVVRGLVLDHMTSDRNFFDRGVELNYTVNAGPVQTVTMLHNGGQVYRGEIPGQSAGSHIEYFVLARDWNMNEGTGETLAFDVEGPVEVPGDVNGDGIVDVQDLTAVITGWGPCPAPPDPCPADLDGNGEVDVQDMVEVITNWT